MVGDTYYFAVTRLLVRTGQRGEKSSAEAHVGAACVFVVTYFFIAAPLFARISPGRILLAVLVAPFFVWILWLILLYVNALMRNILVRLGAISTISARDFQHIMMCGWITLFALSLAGNDNWLRWIGIAWCVLVSLEILATLGHKFLNQLPRPGGA